nr:hypothetical protein [Tanacetum cinerariifolium]
MIDFSRVVTKQSPTIDLSRLTVGSDAYGNVIVVDLHFAGKCFEPDNTTSDLHDATTRTLSTGQVFVTVNMRTIRKLVGNPAELVNRNIGFKREDVSGMTISELKDHTTSLVPGEEVWMIFQMTSSLKPVEGADRLKQFAAT